LVDRLVDGLVENQQNILKVIKTNPRVSKKQMAEIIGISTTAIDKNIEKLKKLGLLKRVGSPKSGYWEVTQ
jgi:ATP-dependent DNA helicase RecG